MLPRGEPVTMPEITVDKHCYLDKRKYDVRLTGEFRDVRSESKSISVE